MFEKKNQVTVVIDDCKHCPNATLKFDPNSGEDIMYCQTCRSILMLREGWGSRPIPDWCPRIKHTNSPLRGLRATIPGLIN